MRFVPSKLQVWSRAFKGRLDAWRKRLPSKSRVWSVFRRPVRVAVVTLIAFGGCWLGLYLGASSHLPVGPVETTMRLVPAYQGETAVMVPPLGRLGMDSHQGPLRLDVTVDRIDQEDAQRIFRDPAVLANLQAEVTSDLRQGVTHTLVRGLVAGTLGAGLVTLVVLRRIRTTVIVTGATAGALLASYGIAGLTWNPRAITEPRFDGLLTSAPSLIGNAQDIAENFDAYSGELARLVTNVTKLYDVTSTLPAYDPAGDAIKVLRVSDIHLGEHAWGVIRSVVEQYDVDLIVDSGDITDHGSVPENRFLAAIPTLGVPYVWVRGNHDSIDTEEAMRRLPNVTVLDGKKVQTVKGLRFLGAGDPRFTPDNEHRDTVREVEAVAQQARAIASVAEREKLPIDAIVYHDTAGAAFFDGRAELILTGHGHARINLLMPKGSRLMQEGSTGGGGLRALEVPEGEDPAKIEMSVLYIGRYTKKLEAWDEITLGGLGLTSAAVERHQVRPEGEESGRPSPVPTPSGPAPTAPIPSPTISRWQEPTILSSSRPPRVGEPR